MSVFGNIHAFNGFGKPSIKLEFDDNEALLDFQKKMQAAGDDSELPEVDFEQIEGVKIKKNPNIIDFYTEILKDSEKITPQKFSYKLLENEFGKGEVFKINTPIGVVDFYKKTIFEKGGHILKHINDFFNVLKPTLQKPSLIFESEDDKGFKCIDFVKAFKIDGKNKIIIFSAVEPNTYRLKTIFEPTTKDNNYIWRKYIKGGEKQLYPNDYRIPSNNANTSTINGTEDVVFPFEVVNFSAPCKFENNISNNQTFDKENLGAAGDTYIITDTRTRARKNLEDTAALKKYDIRKFSGEELQKMQTDDPLLYEQIKSDINTPATITPLMKQYNVIKQKYPDAVLLFNVGSYYETFGNDAKKIADVLGIKLTNRAGQYYAGFKVRDLEKNIKKLIKAGVKVAVCEQTEQALGAVNYYVKAYYPGLGKTANNAIYNNVGILDWRGFVPTYRILDDYSDFFKIADSKSTFAGFGLDDTKKLIAETCRTHWRDCMAIAKHLKGDSLLQSCFNLWHWLHYNIRYEYDREGREEIRTPLRVWQDRARGVDCDCLSVFAWCVLKCMGYNPAFELVAFKGRPQFSHIFVNCDGVVVDRVWFIFNNRPPLITKSEIYRVNLTNDLAGLF